MKTYLKILAVFVLLGSCQSNKKERSSMNTIVEKEKTTQKKITLTEEQFNDFFPKQMGAYKLINVSVQMLSASASASYVKDNDYNHSITYSLQDGNRKGSAAIKNFEVSYKLKNQGPEGTEYIYTERDGYKTIAFLQPQIKRYDVRFVYNNRFRMTLEGTADVDTLWSYIKKEDLQKLDH